MSISVKSIGFTTATFSICYFLNISFRSRVVKSKNYNAVWTQELRYSLLFSGKIFYVAFFRSFFFNYVEPFEVLRVLLPCK